LNDTLTSDFLESYVEKVRYFAEACSRMSVVEMYADFHDGFAGLSYSVIENLREEFGKSISIACFCFPDPYPTIGSQPHSSMKNFIADMNLPLAYYNIAELANMIIPMDISEALSHINVISTKNNKIEVSAAVASAIESAMGTYISDSFSTEEMVYLATRAGHFPICSIEAYVSSLDNCTGQSTFDSRIAGSFEGLAAADTVAATTLSPYPSTLNPFCGSMSSVSSGKWRVQPAALSSLSQRRNIHSFTNVVNFRGTASLGNLSGG
jgi:hypothetical protein